MEFLSAGIIPLLIGAVTLVLIFGLWNMLKGNNPNRSQMLMRWRVGLQFVAIVVIMVFVYLSTE